MKRNEVADMQLNCVECHQDFIWTVKEQINYRLNQYEQPKHCRSCRKKRRDQQTERHVGSWLNDRETAFLK